MGTEHHRSRAKDASKSANYHCANQAERRISTSTAVMLLRLHSMPVPFIVWSASPLLYYAQASILQLISHNPPFALSPFERYEGILFNINMEQATVALQHGMYHTPLSLWLNAIGTEKTELHIRSTPHQVPLSMCAFVGMLCARHASHTQLHLLVEYVHRRIASPPAGCQQKSATAQDEGV